MVRWAVGLLCVVLAGASGEAQSSLAARLDRALRAAGLPIEGVSIGDANKSTTWTVRPPTLQGAAQPIIDAFNATDPAHNVTDRAREVTAAMDDQRISSAIVWVVLKQMFPADTDAQLRTKFGVARTRILAAYEARPWIAP